MADRPFERPSPPTFGFPKIPHYHGDTVRMLFILVAVLSAVAIPLWGDLLPFGLIPQLAGILILVLLAGLTNPHSETVMWINTVVAGLGVLVLEASAISFYNVDPIGLFFAREVSVVLLLIAFYFSIKTVRAMTQGKIGHRVDIGEFK
jgi:hypothetical protein